MSGFWQELIINWGGNAVLGGLIIYLGKIYLERIGRNEQAAIDERLKKLEQDHENLLTKRDHFHQISQQTYQKLFEHKIEVYHHLNNLVSSYQSQDYTDYSQGFDNDSIKYKSISSFIEISEYITSNSTYITPNLYSNNSEWFNLYLEGKAEVSQRISVLHQSNSHSQQRNVIELQEREIELQESIYGESYEKSSNIIAKITIIIEQDIKEIGRFIHSESLK
ncbi:hypothetical protein [Psychrobacter sp. AT9]|uniref:hypothetical protein n=1 Tax=Psychrobacter sp. AT9 TaxID=3242893 RepID=UPI0039A5BEE0